MLVCFLLSIAFFSCAGGAGSGSGGAEAEGASLAIRLPDTSRAVDNKYAKEAIVSFTVTISSGSYNSTKTANKGETMMFSNLPAGDYSVKAYGKTSNGNIAAKCETSVKIVSGETTKTTLHLSRLEYCTVKFFNGTTEINSVQVTNGYKVAKPADLTPEEGHTFSYWGTSSDATTSFDFNSAITSDINLYGVFDVTKYDVTFNYNGGSIGGATSTVLQVAHGSAPDMDDVADPTWVDSVKGTYEFLGWAETADAETSTGASATITGEKTYYAVWKPKYKITFDYQGGTVGTSTATSKDVYVDKNENITIPTAPTKTGFKFKGWATSLPATTAEYGTTATTAGTATEDKTLYAVWLTCYTITYDSTPAVDTTESAFNNKLSYTEGETITLPTATELTKTGLTFGGWYTDAAFTNEVTSIDSSTPGVPGNITLYGKWTLILHLMNPGSGVGNAAYVVNYGSTFASLSASVGGNPPTIPTSVSSGSTKTGYRFVGWYKADDGSGTNMASSQYVASTVLTEETYLHAKWLCSTFNGTVAQFLATEFDNGSSETSPYSITITNVSNASLANVIAHLGEFSTADGTKELWSNLTLQGTNLTEIPNNAFDTSSGNYSMSKILSISLPNSVTKIGDNAFYGMTKLSGITLPSSLQEIGSCAFAYLGSSYETGFSITFPSSLKKIYSNSFWNSKLTSISNGGLQWYEEGNRNISYMMLTDTITKSISICYVRD